MNPDFYSFIIEEGLDDDSTIYSFSTTSGVVYNVYFRPNEYDQYVSDFPVLLHKYFGFGFFRISKPMRTTDNDEKLRATIGKIIIDFLENSAKDTVLLYHCDHSDGKQKGREKVFSSWHATSPHKARIIKNTIELVVPTANGNDILYYMGYITLASNPIVAQIQIEFETFVMHLAMDKGN